MTTAMTVAQKKALAIRDYLDSPDVMVQLERALPKWLNADRFLRVVYTALMKNPKLLECTTQSLLSAMIESAQLGLEPILGKAALIPYGNEVQFQPMYRGLIDLARRTAEIKITAHVVHKMDQFDISYGTDEKIVHKPELYGERGDPIGAYTVWTFPSGFQTFLFMPQADINEVRDNYSKAYRYAMANPKNTKAQETPWITSPGEQSKKTVLKRHSKLQPCSIEVERAVDLDHLAEIGQSQATMPPMFDALTETPVVEEEPEVTGTVEEFMQLASQLEDTSRLDEFIKHCAKYGNVESDEVRKRAVASWGDFTEDYKGWLEKQGPPPPEEFICPVQGCGFKAKSPRGLQKHNTQQHTGIVATPPEPKEFAQLPVEPLPEDPGEEPPECTCGHKDGQDILDPGCVIHGDGEEGEPPASENWFANAEEVLEEKRLECAKIGLEGQFYQILGGSGATNISELIGLGNKQAVEETVKKLDRLIWPEPQK